MITLVNESRIRETDGKAPSATREARALPGSPPDRGNVLYSKRRLPHFERPWAKYAIAFSTRECRTLLAEERNLVMESILHGACTLQYELYVACVMPDHVHLLLEPQVYGHDDKGRVAFWSLSQILQGIKSTTSHRINKPCQSKGPLWEKESFDRLIRSESDLHEKFHYICKNPWRSNVVDSSQDYPWLWTPDCLGITPANPGSARASRAASGASPEASFHH